MTSPYKAYSSPIAVTTNSSASPHHVTEIGCGYHVMQVPSSPVPVYYSTPSTSHYSPPPQQSPAPFMTFQQQPQMQHFYQNYQPNPYSSYSMMTGGSGVTMMSSNQLPFTSYPQQPSTYYMTAAPVPTPSFTSSSATPSASSQKGKPGKKPKYSDAQLSPGERSRQEIKRARNRDAARRSRDKKDKLVASLKSQQAILSSEIQQLNAIISQYRNLASSVLQLLPQTNTPRPTTLVKITKSESSETENASHLFSPHLMNEDFGMMMAQPYLHNQIEVTLSTTSTSTDVVTVCPSNESLRTPMADWAPSMAALSAAFLKYESNNSSNKK